MKKRIAIVLVLVLCLSLAACGRSSREEKRLPEEIITYEDDVVLEEDEYDEVGTCGEDISWGYQKVTGELHVIGSGKMDHYGKNEPAYWSGLVIRSVRIYGVQNVGDFAFQLSDRLATVTIGEGVTKIGVSAFEHCRELHTVTLPKSVTAIGEYAFYDCAALPSMTIPEGVTDIGKHAFHSCGRLTQITLPGSLTQIGEGAFSSDTALTDVYYAGTQEQWSSIAIGADNDPLTSATIHYNS